MAGARLEKVGSIFARMNAMLKKKVLPAEEKPIWYEIYALHPPYNVPQYDQEVSDNKIREILYEEDIIRAKFHDNVKRYETVNFMDNNFESRTKKFIQLYQTLKNQGALDDEKVFEVTLEQLNASGKQNTENEFEIELSEEEIEEPVKYGLTHSFATATEDKNQKQKPKDNKTSSSIDIKSLF